MDMLPKTMTQVFYKPSVNTRRKRNTDKLLQLSYIGMSSNDAFTISMKKAYKEYSNYSDDENFINLVIGLENKQFMNVNYLSAAVYLYNTYEKDFKDDNDYDVTKNIKPEMLEDSKPAMKKIKNVLDKVTNSYSTTEETWCKRKLEILTYLNIILLHKFDESEDLNRNDFKPFDNREGEGYEKELDFTKNF